MKFISGIHKTLLLPVVLAITACGGGGSTSSAPPPADKPSPDKPTNPDKPPSPADPYAKFTPNLKKGKNLFEANCASCHGIKAKGGIGPNIQGKKPADIRKALETVLPMTYLPEFFDQELVDIAAHLEVLKKQSDAQKNQQMKVTLQLTAEYSEVRVTDFNRSAVYYHPSQPKQANFSINVQQAEFPISVSITDQLTSEQQQHTLYTPQKPLSDHDDTQ